MQLCRSNSIATRIYGTLTGASGSNTSYQSLASNSANNPSDCTVPTAANDTKIPSFEDPSKSDLESQ